MSLDEIPPGDRVPGRVGGDGAGRARHERLGTHGEQIEGRVVVERLGQFQWLAAADESGRDSVGLHSDTLVEGLMVAEAGKPRHYQPVRAELAERELQQSSVVREAELAPEDVGPVRACAVRLPEDVIRPVERLHALVAGPAGSGAAIPPSKRARKICSSFHCALSIASPVVTTRCGDAPVAGPRTALSVRTVASTAREVSASCGRCTGTIWAYRGSANRRLRNSNLVGDWTSAICRSVMCARQSSGRPGPCAGSAPGMPTGPRTRCGSPPMISMA